MEDKKHPINKGILLKEFMIDLKKSIRGLMLQTVW